MSVADTATGQKLKYTVSLATEEDIPAIASVQFKAFSTFAPDALINGKDTPANQANVAERHREDMRNESGLRIAKVQLDPESRKTGPSMTSSEHNSSIIGFAIFCLPNEDAPTPLQRIPKSIRPRSMPIQAAFIINDPARRTVVERNMTVNYNAVQAIIAGRDCAWVRCMSVVPEYQGFGIGKALMEWGCRLFDEHGVSAGLMASPAGLGLYLRFGFKVVGKTHFEVGVDANSAGDGGGDGDADTQKPRPITEMAIMWRDAVVKSAA